MIRDAGPASGVIWGMRYSTLVAILCATACGTGPLGPNVQQTGKDEFAVGYGASFVVPGTPLEIAFQALLGDSRCPSDVVCVWEGEGRVELGLTLGDGPTVPVELNTRGPRTATHGGFLITLVELDPYPVSTRPQVPADYVAHLRVSALTR